jgi:hypothetical protein
MSGQWFNAPAFCPNAVDVSVEGEMVRLYSTSIRSKQSGTEAVVHLTNGVFSAI